MAKDDKELEGTKEQENDKENDKENKDEQKNEVSMLNTKPIPSVCMLAGGLIRCIFGILYRDEIKSFLWSLVLVMIIFYFIGICVKMVLDRNFKMMIEDAPVEEKGEEKELENIEDEGGNMNEGGFIQEKLSEQLGDDDNSESFE
ncbi:MAG: hypothetical protein E7277_03930 [Lachnospiraceae bacterium]|jgi:Na+/glutamate symporter|nr:hypothetical protein [Lachnospiraceae bacterium]